MPAGRRIFLMPPRSVHVRAEVPIRTPRDLRLIANILGEAGLELPATLLGRADEVIE